MSTTPKHTNVAVVEIDHIQLLLPMPSALKVMEILNKAVRVESDYGDIRNVKLVLGMQPRLELRMVRSDDLVVPKPAPAPKTGSHRQASGPALLGHELGGG